LIVSLTKFSKSQSLISFKLLSDCTADLAIPNLSFISCPSLGLRSYISDKLLRSSVSVKHDESTNSGNDFKKTSANWIFAGALLFFVPCFLRCSIDFFSVSSSFSLSSSGYFSFDISDPVDGSSVDKRLLISFEVIELTEGNDDIFEINLFLSIFIATLSSETSFKNVSTKISISSFFTVFESGFFDTASLALVSA